MKIDDEQEPLFESVEAMCEAYGWPPEVCAQIKFDMLATAHDAEPDTTPTLH